MLTRALVLTAVMVAGGWAAGQEPKGNVHEGKVGKVVPGEDKLVMTDKDGKNEHSHFVARDVKVTVGGKAAKWTDLQPGQLIKVTTKKVEDQVLVVQIEAQPAK